MDSPMQQHKKSIKYEYLKLTLKSQIKCERINFTLVIILYKLKYLMWEISFLLNVLENLIFKEIQIEILVILKYLKENITNLHV